ncbi:MAG: DUF799 family lipoprotein [Desulfobacterales bacterium]
MPKIRKNSVSSPPTAGRWFFILCLSILMGCASTPSDPSPESPCPVIVNTNLTSIAILPFVNKTRDEEIAKLVRDAFYCHLSVRRYRDIEMHVVDRILEAHNLTDLDVLYRTPVKELGRLLDCDAVVFGEITNYQKLFLGVYSQMAVGATISVWDTRSNRMVWSDQHTARFHEGGVPFSLVEIPFISVRSGLNLRDRVKMRTLDELSRYLTARMPSPADSRYTSKIPGRVPVGDTRDTFPEVRRHPADSSGPEGGPNDSHLPILLR